MPLHRVTITDQLDWLPCKAGQPALAAPELPAGYGAYLKLLPPLGIDRSVPIADYSFAQRTVAELNARAAFWQKYGIVQGQPSASHLQPITYREVAASLGLAYDSHIDNAAIMQAYGGHWPPHLGTSELFTQHFIQQLVSLLGPATEVFFYGLQAEGSYVWDANGLPTDWLEQGALADLPVVYARDGAWPIYLAAADRSWCFYQPEWVEWLTLSCHLGLAQKLLVQSNLEVFELGL